ncbi:MAG: hypothetical protein AB1814_05405 [Thermodesulfobacteriota bacterium]
MNGLAKVLSRFPQFWDRVRMSEEFAPLGVKEVVSLATELAGLTLDDRSAEQIRRTTHGNLRQTIVHLARLEVLAKAEGSPKISPEWTRKVTTEISRSRLRAAGTNLKMVK